MKRKYSSPEIELDKFFFEDILKLIEDSTPEDTIPEHGDYDDDDDIGG